MLKTRLSKRKRRASVGSLGEYLTSPTGSMQSLVRFYQVWSQQPVGAGDCLGVRYEDLHEDPRRELRRIFEFLGGPAITERSLEAGVKAGSFDRLREAERHGKFKARRLRAKDVNDPESFKTREGKVGGYERHFEKEKLTVEEREFALEWVRKMPEWCGYGQLSSSADSFQAVD